MVADRVQKLRQRLGLVRVVLVGDRGMLTETQIDKLRQYPGRGWISALRGPAIRELVAAGSAKTCCGPRKRTPLLEAEIARKVGKHFSLTIADGVFGWVWREQSIRREGELDGIYVVRTGETSQ